MTTMKETRELINYMIENLLDLKDNIEDYGNNNDGSLDRIIENIGNCDKFYDTVKEIILDNIIKTREDVVEVEETDNGIEFK